MSDELPGWLSEPTDPVARQLALRAAVERRLRRQTEAGRDPFGEIAKFRANLARFGWTLRNPEV